MADNRRRPWWSIDGIATRLRHQSLFYVPHDYYNYEYGVLVYRSGAFERTA